MAIFPDMRARGIFLALAAGLLCAACSHADRPGEEAFIGDRSVTLWTSLAQVRQQVATLHYGERVEIMERQNDQAHVRTAAGVLGWTDQRNLMDSALWHRARDLAQSSLSMPVQARATTDKLTNVHIGAGRTSPRTYQLRSGARLEILGRAVADYVRGGSDDSGGPSPGGTGSAAPEDTKHEDWALVHAHEDPAGDVAGWVLRRFIKYEIPPEMLDYSTQFRFVAWFELGRVPAGEPEPGLQSKTAQRPGRPNAPGPPESLRTESRAPGAPSPSSTPSPTEFKPQFLVAGIQGPEGQPCDFTLIRVYTWGAQRQRYETAFVESNLCGSLPIRVQSAGTGVTNPEFAFVNRGRAGEEDREYAMHQTSVHRMDNRRSVRGRH